MHDNQRLLDALRAEHRSLDAEIAELRNSPERDDLLIARMKKRKLRLRDEIALIEDSLVPDIIA